MLSLSEFNEWSGYHESCFRGFLDFLIERDEREGVWRQALEGYTVAELKQASHAIFAATEKPVGWTSHMESMQRHLRRFRDSKREQENAAQYARRCGLCEGTGRVDVVSLPGHEVSSVSGAKLTHYVVACKCGLGDQYREKKTDKGTFGYDTFDAGRMETRNAWYLRKHAGDPARDEAAKSLKATLAYCKAQFANFGTPPPAAEVKR
jgi:hypothetical protein